MPTPQWPTSATQPHFYITTLLFRTGPTYIFWCQNQLRFPAFEVSTYTPAHEVRQNVRGGSQYRRWEREGGWRRFPIQEARERERGVGVSTYHFPSLSLPGQLVVLFAQLPQLPTLLLQVRLQLHHADLTHTQTHHQTHDIIILYIYHALINALSAHMTRIKLVSWCFTPSQPVTGTAGRRKTGEGGGRERDGGERMEGQRWGERNKRGK